MRPNAPLPGALPLARNCRANRRFWFDPAGLVLGVRGYHCSACNLRSAHSRFDLSAAVFDVDVCEPTIFVAPTRVPMGRMNYWRSRQAEFARRTPKALLMSMQITQD